MGGIPWRNNMKAKMINQQIHAPNPAIRIGEKITVGPARAKAMHILRWSAGWIVEKG
jgi:hypothetical protein